MSFSKQLVGSVLCATLTVALSGQTSAGGQATATRQSVVPQKPIVLWKEDFEGEQPEKFALTHHNAKQVTVAFAGVSEEHAAGGKRSFKIAATLTEGNYAYWIIKVDAPFTHPLKIRGKVRREGEVDVQVGYYFRNVDTGASSLVRQGTKIADRKDGWSTWECYDPGLLKSAQQLRLQAVGVFIFPSAWRRPRPAQPQHYFKNTAAVAYVDDLEVIRMPRPKPPGKVPRPQDIREYRVVPVAPLTESRILASSPVIPDDMKRDRLSMTAAQDEYESASFAILSGQQLDQVKVTMTDLVQGAHRIAAADLRVVKCWFLPTDYDEWLPITVMYPELLLHDDELIKVDIPKVKQSIRATTTGGETRYFDISKGNPELKPEYTIEDAASLQPVQIRPFVPQQFWLTVHVPVGAAPGEYRAEIVIEPQNAPSRRMPVVLRVLPFRLPAPVLEYSHYYRAKLKTDGAPLISSEWKTEQQLEAEFRDMQSHGVNNPAIYQGVGSGPDAGKALQRYLTVWDRVGLSKERLFMVAAGASNELEQQRKRLAMAKRFGFRDLYAFGSDEASGERLLAQRNFWTRTRGVGLKIAVACNPDFDELVGDLLDAPILGGPARPDLAARVRQRGYRIYMYGNPQYGHPNPVIYRRNFGLSLWRAGYHGAVSYAYQHAMTWHPWNDFANGRFPKMTYPTTSGVVGTISWEGFRETIDDVRYLTRLLGLLDRATAQPATRKAAT
ncbi:MAG: hypothetical protein CMJ59_00005, partial [Planctomycetaceae bacterium]|nr:hypothetical protein [Planctomycetaceae bacterium]